MVHHSTPEVPVRADPAQLDQVVTNLVTNAKHSSLPSGTISVHTDLIPIGMARPCPCQVRRHPGPLGLLMVEDDGTGMEPEVAARIFEPFFSTRDSTTGTGLGLATVSDIVERSGGHVCVTSAVGKGAVFRVFLPADL